MIWMYGFNGPLERQPFFINPLFKVKTGKEQLITSNYSRHKLMDRKIAIVPFHPYVLYEEFKVFFVFQGERIHFAGDERISIQVQLQLLQ